MRDDMKKVLTERPRHGRVFAYHDFRRRENRGDEDLLPSCQGMRRPFQDYCKRKEFSDLLGPLKRYLLSCVGRRWDDVWSEVCTNVDANSVTGEHLRFHVDDLVTKDCVVVDGEVREQGRWSFRNEVDGLYVHPVDGVLRHSGPRTNPRRAERRRSKILDGYRYLVDGHRLVPLEGGKERVVVRHGVEEAVLLDGIWYWVVFADAPVLRSHTKAGKDGVTMQQITAVECRDLVTGKKTIGGRYRSGKRQMSARDLRRFEVTNAGG